jgi:hypothetical protein
MKILFAFIGGMITVMAGLFIAPLLGSLFGAFGGWVVGLFFSDTILGILAQLGIKGVAMWQVGLFLGFVGGFFAKQKKS